MHDNYKPANKLKDKVVVITGGDSGIGRAIAYHAAAEGAHVVFAFLEEEASTDARETQAVLERIGTDYLTFCGDLGDPENCQELINQTLKKFNKIDCLINNHAEQHAAHDLLEITPEQLERTFRTNIFSYFYLTQAALPHLKKGSTIINSASIVAYRGSPRLMDYAATKGAIVAFTRSIAKSLLEKGIRVNAVAPGPVWTPLIPSGFSPQEVSHFGDDVPMKEAAQPADIAPCYIFLASDESRFFTGQVLHPNGGVIINV